MCAVMEPEKDILLKIYLSQRSLGNIIIFISFSQILIFPFIAHINWIH